jgi:hypothetical protein
MIVFASFNGGPTDQTVYLAILASCITGVLVGMIARRLWIGFLAGVLSGALISGAILIGGNRPGDAAGLFLVGALIFVCPLCGVLGGVGAAMSAWIAGHLLRRDHEPTQKGASSTTDAGHLSSAAAPGPSSGDDVGAI